MAVVTLCSAAGSPGVSSTVIGLALAWTRPCVLLEADPTGSSAMLTGYMHQYAPTGVVSVFDLAVRYRQTGTILPLMDVTTLVPNTQIRLLSGPRTPAHAVAAADVWHPLMAELHQLHKAGIDVIIDLGRLGMAASPAPVLEGSDLVLLVTRSTLPALVPARHGADQLADAGSGRAGLLLIGPGHPYSASDVAKQLKLPVITTLPDDPTTAEVFHLGAKPGSRFNRSPLYRALPPAVSAIQTQLDVTHSILLGDQT